MNSYERFLKIFLRVLGTSAITAIIFVAAPYSWMDSIHRQLGMGQLPDAPVVGYLARSTSAFYVFQGGLAWLISYDLRRYRQLLIFLSLMTIAMGLALFAIDWIENLPPFWRLSEGPIDTVFGVVMLWLAMHVHERG